MNASTNWQDDFSLRLTRRRETGYGVAEHGAVVDAEGFDPALLAEGETDEKTELDQLGNGEVLMKFFPERVVSDVGIPSDGAGVSQRNFFSFGELVRVGEVQELVVLLFGEAFPSALDGALDPSVVAVDRLRDVDAAQLLHRVVEDAVPERQVPRLRERADDRRECGKIEALKPCGSVGHRWGKTCRDPVCYSRLPA